MQRESYSAIQAPVAPASSNDAGASFLPVANGTHFNGNLGGPATNLIQTRCRQSRKLLRVIAGGADQIQVEWANIYTITVAQANDASCEMAGPNSVTARMSIEYPAGKPRQVSGSTAYNAGTAYAVFDQVTSGGSAWVCIQAGTGQTPVDGSAYWRRVNRYVVRWVGDTDAGGTIVFPAGSYKKSLPLQLSEKLIAGDCIAVLGAFDSGASSGTYIPYAGANGAANHGNFVDWVVDSAGGLPALGSALPDTGVVAQTNGNTTAANAADNLTWMKIPYATAITGNLPVQRCVALFGDSIMQGYGGDIRDGEPAGIFPRALDGVSWWRIAQGGNTARAYAPGNAPWQMSVVSRCSSAIVNLGLNDMMAGGTAAQVQSWLTRAWRELARTGTPVYGGQLTPISSSTDGWATVANQGRFTNGGTVPTTQFPTDADYASTVYGTVAQWISQDGASVTVADGGTARVGQAGHPLKALLDWKGLLADAATSWKWLAGFTADGVHPISAAAQAQAVYLGPQLDGVALGRQIQASPLPAWSPTAEAAVSNMRRPAAAAQSAVTSGSVMGVVGTSPGRYFYGLRAYRGAGATAGNRAITFAMGNDPAKLKVVSSFTTAAGANTGQDIGVGGGALWVPHGYLLVVQLQCLSANDWVGQILPSNVPNMNKTGGQLPLAGTSADTATIAVGTVLNLATKWTAAVFCPFLEAY